MPSRFTNYSLIAATAGMAGGATANADVTVGSFDLTFGKNAGVGFFDDVAEAVWSTYTAYLAMGSLSCRFEAFIATGVFGADAFWTVEDTGGNRAGFQHHYWMLPGQDWNRRQINLEEAGAVWEEAGASSFTWHKGNLEIFKNARPSYGTTWSAGVEGTKYVNFEMHQVGPGGSDIYGWIQFDFDLGSGDDWSVTVSNWAYTDEGPLPAGSTGTPPVPGLSGLAALAMGAAGLRSRRQRTRG